MTRLPLEVAAHILRYTDDPTALACLLVHRDWLPFARERLFETVSIASPKCSKKILFFEQSPHLTSYVRVLLVFWIVTDPSTERSLELEATMSRLHQVFPKVQRLSLASSPATNWSSVPSSIASSFRTILASGSVNAMILTWWRFSETADELAELLRSCSDSLESLKLRQLNMPFPLTDVVPNPALTIAFPKLRDLQLASRRGLSFVGPYHLSAPKLSSLTWSSVPHGLNCLPNFLPLSELTNVSSFSLHLNFEYPFITNPTASSLIDTPWHLPSLRSLTINAMYPPDLAQVSLGDIIDYLLECITKIPSAAILEHICFSFMDEEEYQDVSAWGQLDSQLVSLHQQGALQRVEFKPPVPEAWLPIAHSLGLILTSGLTQPA